MKWTKISWLDFTPHTAHLAKFEFKRNEILFIQRDTQKQNILILNFFQKLNCDAII